MHLRNCSKVELNIKFVSLLFLVVDMGHPDTFLKATVYVDATPDEIIDDVKLSDIEYDVKLIEVEVDAKPVVAEVDICA